MSLTIRVNDWRVVVEGEEHVVLTRDGACGRLIVGQMVARRWRRDLAALGLYGKPLDEALAYYAVAELGTAP